MIAIIDSGSTKADWVFTDGKTRKLLTTAGMNPNFVNGNDVIKIVKEGITDSINPDTINFLFFFGSGCSSEIQKKIISDALKTIFTKAEIVVGHDTMGSVLATCGDKAGISCIIGTGSNSVYFDGKNILPNNYGLGFILGDEGAGTQLGKKLLTNYMYGTLPKDLSDNFRNKYNISRDDIINNVYNNPTANAWLASFAQFYSMHKENSWVRKTIKEGFEEFTRLFVMNYKEYKNVPVHFVGSIAFTYKDILAEIAKEKNFILGNTIQKPIDGLVDYYLKKLEIV